MNVTKEIEPSLNDRKDLIQILDAAADYLASRDTDADTQARARWKLWSGPNGEAFIGLQLDDQDFSAVRTFTPNQLADENRELRLVMLWNDVLSRRSWREFERVNELIRQFRED